MTGLLKRHTRQLSASRSLRGAFRSPLTVFATISPSLREPSRISSPPARAASFFPSRYPPQGTPRMTISSLPYCFSCNWITSERLVQPRATTPTTFFRFASGLTRFWASWCWLKRSWTNLARFCTQKGFQTSRSTSSGVVMKQGVAVSGRVPISYPTTTSTLFSARRSFASSRSFFSTFSTVANPSF